MMKHGEERFSSLPELRRKAEVAISRGLVKRAAPTNIDLERLVDELEVHQVELALQNEELHAIHGALERDRDRYRDLYELAPIGYLTLDRDGVIRELNLRAGVLLGDDRARLAGRALASLMQPTEAVVLQRHLSKVFSSSAKHACDLVFGTGQERDVAVRIESIAFDGDGDTAAACRCVVIDLSELRSAKAGLRSTDARSDAILDTLDEAIVSSDTSGRIESFNKAAERLFGYVEAEVLGKQLRMLLPERDRGDYDAFMRGDVSAAEPSSISRSSEANGLRKNGTTFPLELSIAQWSDRGEPKLAAALRDISKRSQREAELRESEARFRTLADSAPVLLWMVGTDGLSNFFNQTWLEFTGRTLEQELGDGWLAGVHPDDLSHCMSTYIDAFAARRPFRMQYRLRRADGQYRWVLDAGIPRWSGDRSPAGYIRAAIDIGDIKQLESELRESEQRFQQITQHNEDVFWIHDRERRTSYVSPAFESIWGRPAADALGTRSILLAWVHPDDRSRVSSAYDRLFNGDCFDEKYRVLRPDASVRWIRARAFVVHEPGGAVSGDIGMAEDITVDHELDYRLHQAQKLEAVGAFASAVAHDFNNVLHDVFACVSLARDESTSEERVRQYLDRAAGAIRRGGELGARLVAFARKRKSEPRPIEIDTLIAGSAMLLGRLLSGRTSLRIETHAEGQAIVADPAQIEQILSNLAANARDAMPQGGTLSLRTSVVGAESPEAKRRGLAGAERYVSLVVEDTGTGMDESTRLRIFDPFFTTKELGKGSGLGLPTVLAITQQLGGIVNVESMLGKGTTFSFYFPCTEQIPERLNDGPRAILMSGTALLVETEPLVRMTVSRYLEELGLVVLEADSADEAQRICATRSGPVDLLVSDFVLPGMNGSRLATLLKQRYPALHVLFMSTNIELSEQSPERLPKRVLRKPFDKAALAVELAALFEDRAFRERASGESRDQKTVLVVDHDPIARVALEELLQQSGYRAVAVARPSHALAVAAEHPTPIDLLLTDMRLPEMNGDTLAAELQRAQPGVRVIFLSGLATPAAQAAAFVQKPVDFEALLGVIDLALGVG